MAAQKHRDTIVAWAKGEPIQYRQHHSGRWVDAPDPAWIDDYEYRVKPPEPERVYPQTKLGFNDFLAIALGGHPLDDINCTYQRVANAALRHACDAGQVVPREEFDRAIGERDKRDMAIALAIYDASFDWCTKQLSSRSQLPALEIQAIIAGVK